MAKPIGLRISEEAKADFENFKKILGIKENTEALRICLLFSRFMFDYLYNSVNSEFAKSLPKKQEELRKKLSKYPEYAEIQQMIKDQQQEFDKLLHHDYYKKLLNIYAEKKPVGRPKKIKKIGRPKNKKGKRGRPSRVDISN